MHYKNIIFDFGNVIAKFDGNYILRQFCDNEEEVQQLAPVVYRGWSDLDKGTTDYDDYAASCEKLVPRHMQEYVRNFFRDWPHHLQFLQPTLDLIRELKENGAHIYLLSNAPTRFAEYAAGFSFLNDFDGIVFSAPVKMAKPSADIYTFLFDTYDLNPRDCFFIDDLKENIEAGRKLGMEGIVFTGDISSVKKAVGL